MDTVKRVYTLIEERDMSLYQLSRLSGVSYSTVKTTEKRGGQLKVDTIERICQALGITMGEFFEEKSVFAGFPISMENNVLYLDK